jgi:hypothetical protein
MNSDFSSAALACAMVFCRTHLRHVYRRCSTGQQAHKTQPAAGRTWNAFHTRYLRKKVICMTRLYTFASRSHTGSGVWSVAPVRNPEGGHPQHPGDAHAPYRHRRPGSE